MGPSSPNLLGKSNKKRVLKPPSGAKFFFSFAFKGNQVFAMAIFFARKNQTKIRLIQGSHASTGTAPDSVWCCDPSCFGV